MEYFTNYLWFKMHCIPPLEKELTDEEWGENVKLYWNRYNKLVGRLPKRVFHKFSGQSFHDAKLESFCIIQSLVKYKKIVNVELIVTEYGGSGKWKITYSNVHTINMKFMEESYHGFSDWG